MQANLPHYQLEETARLMSAVPHSLLARPQGALHFLQRHLRDVRELEPVLVQYPGLRYEPLDFAYVVLQSLGALDVALIEDLTQHFGWRGVVWGSLLTALCPRSEFGPALRAARAHVPHNTWAVDLALAALGEPVPNDLEHLHAVLQGLRAVFAHVKKPTLRLPTVSSIEEAQQRAHRVREAYRQGGLPAALSARNDG